jgi:hypothetical protein
MEIPAPKDCDGILQLNAERECQTLEILATYGLSDIARDRVEVAIAVIRAALNARRRALGLRPLELQAVA